MKILLKCHYIVLQFKFIARIEIDNFKGLVVELGDMPYRFNFDLSRVSKSFFRELAKVAHEKDVHRRIGKKTRNLAEKFKIRKITGLEVSDALTLVEDLVDLYVSNISGKEKFLKTRKRALLLPHCARKYMDNRCKAIFDQEVPSYFCASCSPDCLINRATVLGKKKGYDVYVLPGGSCVPKILKNNFYDGIVGVACSQELTIGGNYLEALGRAGQAVPLVKNGCANTRFSVETLERTL